MTTQTRPTAPSLDIQRIRADFPILHTKVNGKPLVYLDNGATTQKPSAVIDAIVRFYETQNSNIHRGVYQLSQTATSLYEGAREKVRAFINAGETAEVLFTRGTTEGINLVASSWGRTHLKPSDEILVSHLEHHSDIVPWQFACNATGATLRVIPVNDAGELIMSEYEKLLASGGGRVKMVAVNHVSNALGTINPVREIIQLAHRSGALALIDGAQWVAHGLTDVQALDADFYAFSGHKLIGPTGIGVLYGKRALLDAMPPYQGGGDMIASVTFPKTEYAALPNKFEAGTPDIAGVVGLGAAIDYIQSVGLDAIADYEQELLHHATRLLSDVPGLRIYGTAAHKAAVISFTLEGYSTLDIGVKLDREGICVRTGHHCCQPLMERFGITATARASFAFYNTRDEVEQLAAKLREIVAAKATRNIEPQAGLQELPTEGNYWPQQFASSPEDAAKNLIEEFDAIGAMDLRKDEHLEEIGTKMPRTFEMLKKITQRIPGCMSEVYLITRIQPNSIDAIQIMADAEPNADIVRGLIVLLQRLFSSQRADQILAFNIDDFFRKIGLEGFLSSKRRTGLEGMVNKIRDSAKRIVETRKSGSSSNEDAIL